MNKMTKKAFTGLLMASVFCMTAAAQEGPPVPGGNPSIGAKHVINSQLAPKAIGPYSQAVEINGMLFVSGQVPVDPATNKMAGEDIKTQTEQVMKNIGSVLKAAGYDYRDVVKSTCFLSDMENFKAMNEVYAKYYAVDPPARSTVQVVKLPLGALIEIETIAVRQK